MTLISKIQLILNKENKLSIFILISLMIIAMMLEVVGLGLIAPSLTVVLDPLAISNYLDNKLINFIIYNKEQATLILLSALVIVFFLKTLIVFLLNWKQAKIMFQINTRVAKFFYKNYLNSSYQFHLENDSSKMIRNISSEINISTSLINSLCLLFAEITILIGITFFLFLFNPAGSFVISIFLIILGITLNYFTKDKLKSWGNLRKRDERLRVKHLIQGFRGIKEILISNNQNSFVDIYDKYHKGVYNVLRLRTILNPVPRLVFEFAGVFVLSLLILASIFLGKDSIEIVTTLGVFAIAAIRLLPSYNRITTNLQNVIASEPALDILVDDYRKFENLDKKNLEEKESLLFEKEICLKNMSFSYSGRSEKIFKNLNLNINKGSKIAIIGRTGCGKTTLLDLILGLLKPTGGKILVDNVDINSNEKGWQKNISYVPQKIYLTDDTIKKNIAFGVPDELIDEKKIYKVLEIVQLNEFVEKQADKINTFVGEDGVNLSGGQRQRIGIARALYRNTPIIILDEATNALDENTEKLILSSIINIYKNQTVILVTHRVGLSIKFNETLEIENSAIKKLSKNI